MAYRRGCNLGTCGGWHQRAILGAPDQLSTKGPELRVTGPGFGFWILDFGFRILGLGFRV
jgi:hypothetical protein